MSGGVTNTQLAPVLERALEVARTSPPGAVPGAARDVVRGRRLPPTWRSMMRRVLEDDDRFRSLVAADADAEQLGRLPWLWLTRPDGWEEEVDDLLRAESERDEALRELLAAQARVREVEKDLARSEAVVAELRVALGEARDASRQRDDEAATSAELRREIDRLRSELVQREEEHLARVSELTTEMARVGAVAQSKASDLEAAAARIRALEQEVSSASRALAVAREQADAARVESDLLRRRSADEKTATAGPLTRAAGAAHALGEALADLSRQLGTSAGVPSEVPGVSVHPSGGRGGGAVREVGRGPAVRSGARSGGVGGAGGARGGGGGGARGGGGGGARGRHRLWAAQPVELPPAVHADSAEAAAHLVSIPGAYLVVDGYNVAFGWWGRPEPTAGEDALGDIRRRLCEALAGVALRVRRPVLVIFDGGVDPAGGAHLRRATAAGGLLKVRFSPPRIQADRVIVDEVRSLRRHGPVIVVTDDREVREGSGELGANLLTARQLIDLAGRRYTG